MGNKQEKKHLPINKYIKSKSCLVDDKLNLSYNKNFDKEKYSKKLDTEEIDKVIKEVTNKPPFKLLLIGKTGVGKSELINRIFDLKYPHERAKTGKGGPVTLEFKPYYKEGYPLVLYDSKGAEVGALEYAEWKKQQTDFFSQHNKNKPEEYIHAVWYLIDASGDRVEPFDINVIKEGFENAPIFVILTKIDKLNKPEDLDELINSKIERANNFSLKILEEQSYIKGIYKTSALSKKNVQQCKQNISEEKCITCNSEDVIYRKKTNSWKCLEDNCGKSWLNRAAQIPNEIEKLLSDTMKYLPLCVKDSFISAQKYSAKLKIQRSAFAITGATTGSVVIGASPIPFSDLPILTGVQITLFTTIAIIWGIGINHTKSIIGGSSISALITVVGGYAGLTLANLLKLIPGVGTIVGGIINASVAGIITAGLGIFFTIIFNILFDEFGNLSNIPNDKVIERFREIFQNIPIEDIMKELSRDDRKDYVTLIEKIVKKHKK